MPRSSRLFSPVGGDRCRYAANVRPFRYVTCSEALRHGDTSQTVTTTSTLASASGSTITTQGLCPRRVLIMNLPSTTLASNPVAVSSIAWTSTSVTPRCSMRNSAWPVNERSQLHLSGKVGIEPLSGSIVAPRHRLRSADGTAGSFVWAKQGAERPVLNQRLKGGNTEGERCLARGVPRWMVVRRGNLHVNKGDSRAASAHGTCRWSRRLQAVVVGRRSVPPAWWRHCPCGSPTPIPWRERPPEMAAWPAKPRPRKWSLTPRLERCRRPVPAAVASAPAQEFRPEILGANFSDFSTGSSRWFSGSDGNG